MDPVTIYSVAAGGIGVLYVLYSASSYISCWVQDRTLFYIFKYLVYPIFIQRSRLFTSFSRWRVLLTTIYWLGTAACNVVGVGTVAEAGNRAGVLAALHLIPLLFANRPSFAADLLGISLQTYLRLHSSFGVMALLQGLIHTIIFCSHNAFHIHNPLQFNGFVGVIAIASSLILSSLQTPLFEFFQKTHYALAFLTVYAIWRHLSIKPTFARIYLVIATSIFAVTTIARYFQLVLRNVLWHQPYAITRSTQIGDVIRVRISPARPWKVRAGQYVYIWVPGTSFWSSFQSHPFMISWWDQDPQGKGKNIYLLVKPASGFTQKLMQHSGGSILKSWVDGPYGQLSDIGDYGSVIMFASGIGIATQVAYIKELLRGLGEYRVRTRSILLVWQLEKESDQDWVQDWMTELLDQDKAEGSYILHINLYVLRDFVDEEASYGHKKDYGEHDRIKKFYGKPHLETIIKSKVESKRGRLLITSEFPGPPRELFADFEKASSECEMQDQIQKLASMYLEQDIRLIHLAFRPRRYRGFWAPKPPEIRCEGVL